MERGNQYAVVRNAPCRFEFSMLHPSLEQAVAEAERLCRKEQKEFLIFKMIGRVETDVMPIRKEIWG